MPDVPSIFAIDFGTSNSLLAAASRERVFDPAPLDAAAPDPTVLRSALHFRSFEQTTFGARALGEFVLHGFSGRLVRSVKRHLASPSFTATRIGDRLVTLEELIGAFLRTMRERAASHYGADVRRVLLGRPARFSEDDAADELAETRLAAAARIAGFSEVRFCPEPVAAAHDFAHELAEPRVVLVADLGGGTSDFTLVRLARGELRPEDVLAVGGVALAGDAIDGALVRKAVMPHFGGGCRYRVPFGENVLTMPEDLVGLLSSPAELTLVNRDTVARRLKDIRAGLLDSSEREAIDRYLAVVEDGAGFSLFEAVEACKRALSDRDPAELDFTYPEAEVRTTVGRSELEHAAASVVARIAEALERTLAKAGVQREAVEIACFTGGTARMPRLRAELASRLPAARFHDLSSFHSVVRGLAIRARELENSRA